MEIYFRGVGGWKGDGDGLCRFNGVGFEDRNWGPTLARVRYDIGKFAQVRVVGGGGGGSAFS